MPRFHSLISLILILSHPLLGADWPCWRGSNGLGVADEKSLPSKWSESLHVAWRVDVAGKGASSPVVVGKRVFLTTQLEDTALHVMTLDRESGQSLWDQEIGHGKLPANQLHNMATPTPVSDGRNVWVLFGTGDLVCLDLSGNQVWHRNLVKDFGLYKLNHGYGSSPMLCEGTLFIACMHQGPSYLLAIDAKTGKDLWKVDRNLGLQDEAQDSYSSPLLFRQPHGCEVVLAGSESIDAYDPGHGRRVWSLTGLKVPHPYGRTIAGLAAADGIVVGVASGFQNQGFTVALQPPSSGTAASQLWVNRKFSPDCPTPVAYADRVFTIRDDGMASCLKLRTGEPIWQERLFTENVKVSPVLGGGNVYFLSGQGNCVVVDARASALVVKARNSLHEPTLSTPAIAYGRLFIRTENHLYAIQ